MFILGLTGNIACGKSTVAHILAEQGAAHIDSDRLVHGLYAEPGFAQQVAALFPEYSASLVTPQGAMSRRALGDLVFHNDDALKRLETLVHPAVEERRAEKLRELADRQPPPRAVVVEAVKLIESGQAKICNAVWCVVCPERTQLERLMQTRGLTETQAKQRLEHQPELKKKRRLMQSTPLANTPFVVIVNEGTKDALEQTVIDQWKALNIEKQA